jgi:pyruvate/2-oxoglutarate dehydrogenase complex dihydrolipoamide dehydrogenase (E3) component
MDRKDHVVSAMIERNRNGFSRVGIDLIMGKARFAGERTVKVRLNETTRGDNEETIQANRVVINTGSRPIVPDIPGLAQCDPLTNESILRLDRIPKHLIILGAGYIGCEYAQIYRRLGSEVTLVDRNTRFLPKEDTDIGQGVLELFKDEGIRVLLGAKIQSVSGRSSQGVSIKIQGEQIDFSIDGTDLLVALGRVPNTEELDLSNAGVDLDQRGFIHVNDRLETTAANVWAVGDVTGGPQFTHVSWDDFRIVSENLAGASRSTKNRLIPYTLFTDPELARVGLTCEQAIAQGRSIRVASMPASAIPRAMTSGHTRGLLKAAIDTNTDQILGVSIFCAEAGEILAAIQVAMLSGMSATSLRNVIFSHPTMSESINEWLLS